MKKSGRRLLLINPRFQLSFISWNIAVTALITTVFYGAIYYFFWRFRSLGASAGLPESHVFFKFLGEQQSVMNWCFLVVGAIATIAICVSGLVMSNRVAGPLYRLQKHMNDVAIGVRSDEVMFREKDYFPELADAYNKQLNALKNKFSKSA